MQNYENLYQQTKEEIENVFQQLRKKLQKEWPVSKLLITNVELIVDDEDMTQFAYVNLLFGKIINNFLHYYSCGGMCSSIYQNVTNLNLKSRFLDIQWEDGNTYFAKALDIGFKINTSATLPLNYREKTGKTGSLNLSYLMVEQKAYQFFRTKGIGKETPAIEIETVELDSDKAIVIAKGIAAHEFGSKKMSLDMIKKNGYEYRYRIVLEYISNDWQIIEIEEKQGLFFEIPLLQSRYLDDF